MMEKKLLRSRKKPLIAIFVGYFHPRTGGVETVVINLVKQLRNKGFENITIVTRKHDENLPNMETIQGAKVYRLPLNKNRYISMFKAWIWFTKNRKFLLKQDLWQFHDHTPFLWHLPLLFHKKPRFIVFHGYESIPVKSRYKILRRFIRERVNDYALVGNYLEKYYPMKARNVFYNGIDKIPSKVKKTNDICFVARIDWDTYLMDYLRGLLQLKQKYGLTPSLDVYGDGKQRAQCEAFVKKNKLKVRFKGWTPNADKLVPKYRYTFATQYLTTLSAMAGRSLAFNLGLNKIKKDIAEDFLQRGKFGVICSSPTDLAEKFYYYHKNPKRGKEIIDRAFNYSKTLLWDSVVESIFVKPYKKLLRVS